MQYLETLRLLGFLHLAITALALVLFGLRSLIERRTPQWARARSLTFALLGLVAFASWDGFFQLRLPPSGFSTEDVFHYYAGSKYNRELGYFHLYDCTVAVLLDERLVDPRSLTFVRNLRTMRLDSVREALERGRRCPTRFGLERWRSFERDVFFFHTKSPGMWDAIMNDAGYHPTPVWTLVGGLLTRAVPVEHLDGLLAIDRYLVALALLCVVWAFGVEIGALAAIVWGTGIEWNHWWMGGTYLRHLWLLVALVGLCCLRKEKWLGAGFLLAFAALLRVFPAVFLGGYLLHALRELVRTRSVPAGLARVLAGAALACLVFVPASVLDAGGLDAYREFGAKIRSFSEYMSLNNIGLGVAATAVATWTASEADLRDTSRPRWVIVQRLPSYKVMRYSVAVLFLAAYWFGLRRADSFEAAAMSFTLLPILQHPTNYYFSFVLGAALVAARRPEIGVLLLAGCLAWNAGGLAFWNEFTEFVVASFVAVALCFALVLTMRRPESKPAG